MSRNWSEKQSGSLTGKWFNYKSMGYRLLLINAVNEESNIKIHYILEKDGQIKSVSANVPENSTIPSVTVAFPEGDQMQKEIANLYPVEFKFPNQIEDDNTAGLSLVEWGPFHPLLQEPALFRILMKDEVIKRAWIETGYNNRGVETLCIGEKTANILEMLERVSSVNGFSMGLAFLHAIEEINEIEIPEKAKWFRLVLSEMSFLRANLYSLSHTTKCLGLLSDNSKIFKLIGLFNEAAAEIADDPQLKGLLTLGGIIRDISKDALFTVNAILQEMVHELSAIRRKWDNTPIIQKRLSSTGKIESNKARFMSGRLTRASGYAEDIREISKLPYSELSYSMPVADKNNCLSRIMLMFDDSLLSLELIDQAIEKLPRGDIKNDNRIKDSGDFLVREPDAFGEMVAYVRQEEGLVTQLKIRNSSTLNFPLLPDCMKGIETNDLPLVISSFSLDLAGMEK